MNNGITVALDITGISGPDHTGIAVYTKELIHQFARRPDELRISYYFKGKLFRKYDQFFGDLPGPRPRRYVLKSFAPNTACDINHTLGLKFLYNPRSLNIATVHDVKFYVGEREAANWAISSEFSAKVERFNRSLAKNADHLIAVSETTKRDFCALFDADPDRITVVYLGIQNDGRHDDTSEDGAVMDKYAIDPRKYLFFAGRVDTDKNLQAVVQAFKDTGLHHDLKLVIAGPWVETTPVIIEKVKECGLLDRVVLTGFVATSHLIALYRNAKAFVFPTKYEGFGIPILESMSHGVPVLIGKNGSAPEIAGGLAVVVDPFSQAEISAGMRKVVEDECDPVRLRNHASAFTWERTAEQTLAVYRKHLGRS